MKLYEFAPAPNPRRVRLFLDAKGVEIPTESIDLRAGQQFSSEFRAINPQCTVPVLQLDDGTTLVQVPAIVEYLECTYPLPPLLGRDPLERALIREWSHRTFMEGFMAVAEVLRNSSGAFADRALPGSQNYEQIPALVDRGQKRLSVYFKVLNEHLRDRDHMVGDHYSFADIEVRVLCDFAGWIKRSIPEDCPELDRFVRACSQSNTDSKP